MENKSLKEFTILSASKEPVPGGGGVSAAVGSLAASLGEMVTNLTIGKKTYAQYEDELVSLRNELESLREELLKCINNDAKAFEPLAKAYSMPKDSPNYESTMEKCLVDAANSPFQILKLTTRIIDIDERLAVIGSKLAVSDAATSVMLAHGVLYGTYINIIVNTRLMKNHEYANDLNNNSKAMLDEYAKKALDIFEQINKRLTNG